WIVDQSPGDGDALALATGKLVRFVMQTIAQSYLPQHGRGALPARFRIDPGVNKRKLDIPEAVGTRKKIEGLKNKSDLAIANGCEFIVAHGRNVAAIEFIASGARCIEAAEHVHQRRFAAATGSHY